MITNGSASPYALGSTDSEHERLNELLVVAGVAWPCGDWSYGHWA